MGLYLPPSLFLQNTTLISASTDCKVLTNFSNFKYYDPTSYLTPATANKFTGLSHMNLVLHSQYPFHTVFL